MSVFIAISIVDTWALMFQFEWLVYDISVAYYKTPWKLSFYMATCKLMVWVKTASQICSAYFVLLFTLERFISVRFPLKRASICTRRRISIAIISIVVVALLMTTYELYFYETYHQGTAS